MPDWLGPYLAYCDDFGPLHWVAHHVGMNIKYTCAGKDYIAPKIKYVQFGSPQCVARETQWVCYIARHSIEL